MLQEVIGISKGDVLCVILPSHPKRKDMLKK